jgi:hypothetical protein
MVRNPELMRFRHYEISTDMSLSGSNRFLLINEQIASNCRYHALAQACAVCSPKSASMSVIATSK